MSQKINTNEFLKNVRIGLWRIEVEEGKLPRFYADEVMDELLGITEEITPEERFAFHRRCVHPDDMEMFLEYSDKLTETQTEIVYRYIHPISGEMFVRCAGIRDNSVTSGISIIGAHQDISETIRVEKEKEAHPEETAYAERPDFVTSQSLLVHQFAKQREHLHDGVLATDGYLQVGLTRLLVGLHDAIDQLLSGLSRLECFGQSTKEGNTLTD